MVMVTPGHPVQVLTNVKVLGRRLDDGSATTVDIGGWVAMPREHFDALVRAIPADRLPAPTE